MKKHINEFLSCGQCGRTCNRAYCNRCVRRYLRAIASIVLLAIGSTACGSNPLEPTPAGGTRTAEITPVWHSHTYTCRNTAGTVEYLVPPGFGVCDAGDIMIAIDGKPIARTR